MHKALLGLWAGVLGVDVGDYCSFAGLERTRRWNKTLAPHSWQLQPRCWLPPLVGFGEPTRTLPFVCSTHGHPACPAQHWWNLYKPESVMVHFQGPTGWEGTSHEIKLHGKVLSTHEDHLPQSSMTHNFSYLFSIILWVTDHTLYAQA